MEPPPRPPLAYLITFTTYGTWLHGDERGSVDADHNQFGTPRVDANESWEQASRDAMTSQPLVLTPAQRQVVQATIEEVCRHRVWDLLAANARTNHVHAVITADAPPEKIMNDLKSWCTRRLAEAGHIVKGTHVWTRHGSTRYLWLPAHVEAAVVYVRDEQEKPVPFNWRRWSR